MMVFWLICFALAIFCIGAIALPIFKRTNAPPATADQSALLEQRIAEIRNDHKCGLINGKSANELLHEAKQEFSTIDQSQTISDTGARSFKVAALAMLAATPILAALTYLELGAPEAFSVAQTENQLTPEKTPQENAAVIAAMPEADRQQMIESMVAGLADKLTREPDDIGGWRMLARSYSVLGRLDESASAWRQAAARSNDIEDFRGLATVLLEAGSKDQQPINAELVEVLEKLLAADEEDPLALYFLGHAAVQNNQFEQALTLWERLRNTLPDESPLLANLNGLIETARTELKDQATP